MYQKLGELLTANMHLVRHGDAAATVTDYYDPEQNSLTIELDPNKTPSENAQRFFQNVSEVKNIQEKMQREIAKTHSEINYLDQLLQQIDTAREDDIEEIREELREEGYLKKQKQGKKKNRRNQLRKNTLHQMVPLSLSAKTTNRMSI